MKINKTTGRKVVFNSKNLSQSSQRSNRLESLTDAHIPKTSRFVHGSKALTQAEVEKRAATFSLAEFVELVEEARLPQETQFEQAENLSEGDRSRLGVETLSIFDTIVQSRFGYLVEHLQPKDRKIGAVDMRFVFGLISFLRNARQFFSILANFKRGEVSGHSLTLLAEPGQGFYTGFTFTQLAGFVVGDDHKLSAKPVHWNPVPALVSRLHKVLEHSDPARFRHCEFPKCRHVFYAKRKDQLCCSAKCNNARWQRLWYVKHGKAGVYSRPERKKGRKGETK